MLAGGPVPRNQIQEEAREAEISGSTLKRAKKALGVRSKKTPGPWLWLLPETNGTEGAHTAVGGPLGPLDPPAASKGARLSEEGQEDQGDHFEDDESLATIDRVLRPDERCIHEVLGGCWLCKKKSTGH